MIDQEVFDLASETLNFLRQSATIIATAESCTGGLIAGALTAVPGSSDVVDRGFVTYSNAAKSAMLGVPSTVIDREGAVSDPVARAMAEGALLRSDAGIAIAVTGVAGPGESERKPAGLVFIGCASQRRATVVHEHHFAGDRQAVRRATVIAALELVLSQASPAPE